MDSRRSGKCVLEPHFARVLPWLSLVRPGDFKGREVLRAKARDAIGPRGLGWGPALLLPLRGGGALWLVMGGAFADDRDSVFKWAPVDLDRGSLSHSAPA